MRAYARMSFLGETGMTEGAQEHIRKCPHPANILTWDGPEEVERLCFKAMTYPWSSIAEVIRAMEGAVGEVAVSVTEPRRFEYVVTVTEKELAPWES